MLRCSAIKLSSAEEADLETKRGHDVLAISGRDTSLRAMSATQVAYDRLSEAIVSLDLTPGALANERELAARFGIARPTLVQALHQLADTGLVSILPRRGILISAIDLLDVQQVFDARIALEGSIAELVAQRASADEVAELRSMLNPRREPVTNTQFHAFLDLDERLHLTLARLARNRFLEESLRRVWKVNRRLWHLFFRERGTASNYFLNHDQIIAGIEERDPAAARQAILEHLVSAKQLLHSGLWDH